MVLLIFVVYSYSGINDTTKNEMESKLIKAVRCTARFPPFFFAIIFPTVFFQDVDDHCFPRIPFLYVCELA